MMLWVVEIKCMFWNILNYQTIVQVSNITNFCFFFVTFILYNRDICHGKTNFPYYFSYFSCTIQLLPIKIEVYNPDIIIGGYTLSYFINDFNLNRESKKGNYYMTEGIAFYL